MLRQFVSDQRFALADIILVIISGVVGILNLELAFWFLPITLLPWILRLFAGKFPFRRTIYDWLLFFFLTTAVGGYFVAYDRGAATQKLFFIFISILLFYALIDQPENNYSRIAFLFLGIGICISLYYFLTHNFVQGLLHELELINKKMFFGLILNWLPIPSGYVPGLAIITTCFIFTIFTDSRRSLGLFQRLFIYFGSGLILLTILATKSGSVWTALISAIGTWFLWKIINLEQFSINTEKWFPWIIFLYLSAVIILVYTVGPASSASPNNFGSNSRLEVFARSVNFISDFPITGAGLASFPGLYSNYVLVIPYFYFLNSYNIFLDVAIEQGVMGGMIFLIIQGFGVFFASCNVQRQAARFNDWLGLFVLVFAIVHGLSQDYLYNAAGAMLLFFPLAMSVMLSSNSRLGQSKTAFSSSFTRKKIQTVWFFASIIVICASTFNFDRLRSIWYSNLGALQLAQAELTGFPESGWPGLAIIPKLSEADSLLHTSLQLDSGNLTANYRLGLIYMLNRKFESAIHYLEIAHAKAPMHRGIKKSLGYSYLWAGRIEIAQGLLGDFSEVNGELDAYYWWWKSQGRTDLSEMAYTMIDKMDSTLAQP